MAQWFQRRPVFFHSLRSTMFFSSSLSLFLFFFCSFSLRSLHSLFFFSFVPSPLYPYSASLFLLTIPIFFPFLFLCFFLLSLFLCFLLFLLFFCLSLFFCSFRSSPLFFSVLILHSLVHVFFCSAPCFYRQKQGKDVAGAATVLPPHNCPRGTFPPFFTALW